MFGKAGHVVSISLDNDIPQPWSLEQELQKWETIKQITITKNTVEFECKQVITPELVRFFVEKDYGILGVYQKDYGLDDIYQKYFEDIN
ncbi:hypothetical protein D3C78_1731290 [compost metagenome]